MTIEIDTVETYNTYDVTGEQEARAVWAALPVEEAYPIGSRWVHPSRSAPVTVVGHDHTDTGDYVLVEGSEYPAGSPGRWWRNSLDTYGRMALPETEPTVTMTMEVTPVEEDTTTDFYVGQRVEVFNWENGESTWNGPATVERVDSGYVTVLPDTGEFANVAGGFSRDHLRPLAEEATEEVETPEEAPETPYRPAVGDRVTVVRDDDSPSNNGLTATVVGVNENNRYARYQVDYSEHGGYPSWWVQEVRPLMPSSPEELTAWLEKAKAKAKEEVLAEEASRIREARKEGRDAATQEAAEHMERIVESAHAYAARNQLCRQFDLFMVENGLRPRDTFTQVYRVTYSETFEARDEDHAREQALEALNDQNSYYGQFDIELAED